MLILLIILMFSKPAVRAKPVPLPITTGSYLDSLALNYGVVRMRKRVWWTLWIWNRREDDDSVRARCVEVIRGNHLTSLLSCPRCGGPVPCEREHC